MQPGRMPTQMSYKPGIEERRDAAAHLGRELLLAHERWKQARAATDEQYLVDQGQHRIVGIAEAPARDSRSRASRVGVGRCSTALRSRLLRALDDRGRRGDLRAAGIAP